MEWAGGGARTDLYPFSNNWLVARWMLLIRLAIVTAILGVAMLIMPDGMIDKRPIEIIVGGTYLLTFLYWIALRITGMSQMIVAVQIGFDIFLITVIIHYTGGDESVFVPFYFLSIMCASLFFRRFITFLFTIQAMSFYMFYLYVARPLIDPALTVGDIPEGILFRGLLYSALMYVVAIFSSYYAENLRGKDTALSYALKLLREAKLDTIDILQSMTNGMIALDTAGRLMYMNQVAEQVFELEPATTVGRRYDAIFRDRAEELVKLFDEEIFTSYSVAEREVNIYSKSGTVIPLGLSSMPLYGIDHQKRGVIINFKDLTEKKKLLELVRQSERLAAIGELSAAIAHEIRNPLAAIYNVVEMLTDTFEPEQPQVKQLMRVIERESDRLQRISTDFLHFSRLKLPDMQPLELDKAVHEVLMLIENDPRKMADVSIVNNVPEGTIIKFDVDQLRQIVLNIIINSLDAIGGAGVITIDAAPYADPGADGNGYIRMVISDTGPGFDEDTVKHLFEPFFSTKANGTGLGLALVMRITLGNNGRVFAWNREEGGAEIAIDLIHHGDE